MLVVDPRTAHGAPHAALPSMVRALAGHLLEVKDDHQEGGALFLQGSSTWCAIATPRTWYELLRKSTRELCGVVTDGSGAATI